MPPTSEPTLVKTIIYGVFGNAKQASRILGIHEVNVYCRMREGKLSRRQLRVAVNHGRCKAMKLSAEAGPNYSPARRQESADERQRCLDAVAKAEAMLQAMKTPR
jgi:hypothetical protein